MKIQIHNGLREPQTLEVTRVVVLDEFDNPIAVAVEADKGVIIAETLSKENELQFNQLLRGLGIQKTVIAHEPQQTPLRDIHIPNS